MKRSDTAVLLVLAALWGSSYLFIRLGAGEFGPAALAGVRAAGAALVLVPLVLWSGGTAELRQRWKTIALVGLMGNALPYVLFSYAALSITAGLSSMFTATTPLFAAVISWIWLGERLSRTRVAGLLTGFGGVVWIARNQAGLAHGGASAPAVAACLTATLLYAISANLTRRRLSGVSPFVIAAGSQLTSAVVLAAPTVYYWPVAALTLRAWSAVTLLAIVCTAVAYVLFFRLIARVGAARTVAVTFLIPAFGLAWGALCLGEAVTREMILGCATIVVGTALTTGVLQLDFRKNKPCRLPFAPPTPSPTEPPSVR